MNISIASLRSSGLLFVSRFSKSIIDPLEWKGNNVTDYNATYKRRYGPYPYHRHDKDREEKSNAKHVKHAGSNPLG